MMDKVHDMSATGKLIKSYYVTKLSTLVFCLIMTVIHKSQIQGNSYFNDTWRVIKEGSRLQEMRQMQYSFLVFRMLLKVGSGIIAWT